MKWHQGGGTAEEEAEALRDLLDMAQEELQTNKVIRLREGFLGGS
jgi:hypothetical protein